MTIFIATDRGPVWLSAELRLGGGSNLPPGSDFKTPVERARSWVENFGPGHSVLLNNYATKGFPRENATTLEPCRRIHIDLEDEAFDVQGGSQGLACALALYTYAVGKLTQSLLPHNLVPPNLFPDFIATGSIASNGTVGEIALLTEKIDEAAKKVGDEKMPFVMPTANKGMLPSSPFILRRVAKLDDVLELVFEWWSAAIEPVLTELDKSLPQAIRWAEYPADWWPNRAYPSAAVQMLAVSPGARIHACNPDLREIFQRSLAGKAASSAPYAMAFDRLLLRYAATAYVLEHAPAASARASAPHDPATSPVVSSVQAAIGFRLHQYRGSETDDWGSAEWATLVDQEPLAQDSDPSLRAELAVLARLRRGAAASASLREVLPQTVQAQSGDSSVLAADPVQPKPLAWNAQSLVRLGPSTSFTSPIMDAWISYGDLSGIEEIVIVGSGMADVRAEVVALASAVHFRVGDSSDAICGGLISLREDTGENTLSEQSATLTAWRGALTKSPYSGATHRGVQLDLLATHLKGIALRTGLVRVHETPAETKGALLEQLDAMPADGVQGSRVEQCNAGEGVALRPIMLRGAPGVVNVPVWVIRVPGFSTLTDIYARATVQRIEQQLHRRIAFYARIENEAAQQRLQWHALSQKERDESKPVVVNKTVDFESTVEVRTDPREIPAATYYTQNVPELESSGAKYKRRMLDLLEGVRRASASALPRSATQLFVDGAIRGLEAADLVPDCSPELRYVYDAWRREVGPLLQAVVRRWCERLDLAHEQRAQVLTRHVLWRTLEVEEKLLLVPHALVHGRQSSIVCDPRRELVWFVHPLDASQNVPTQTANDGSAGQARQLVEQALKGCATASLELPDDCKENLNKAWNLNPIETWRALKTKLLRESALPIAELADAARKKMQAFVAYEHGSDGLPFTAAAALEAMLCEPGKGSGHSAYPRPLRKEFEPEARMPELPWLLARIYEDFTLRNSPEAGVLREMTHRLRELVQEWDSEFARNMGVTIPGVGTAGPLARVRSKKLLEVARRNHLTTDEHGAYSAERARELFQLAIDIRASVSEIHWDSESLRSLYVSVGEIADRLAVDFPGEFGLRPGVLLLQQLGILESSRRV